MPGNAATSESGAGAIGWVGLDAPLELIEAAGLRPERISADARSTAGLADAYGEGGYEITISATTLAAEKVIMDGVRKLLQ